MLKLILAVSADDYLARGSKDNMSWTGPMDKAAFRLLTSVGGVCGVGHSSWKHMPKSLPGRTLIPLTSDGRLVSNYDVTLDDLEAGCSKVPKWAAYVQSETLGRFAYTNPDGWLLGGPRLAYEALCDGLVDQVYMCRSPVMLFERGEPFDRGGIPDTITPWLSSRGEIQNAGIPWRVSQRIQLGNIQVDCWSTPNVHRPRP